MKSSVPATLAFLLGLALTPSVPAAFPQDDDRVDCRQRAQLDRLLAERNREVLHEGDPLALSGLDQGDDGFRARTPILLQSDGAVARVDEEENYARRLALYEGGTSFYSPLAVRSLPATRLASEPEPAPAQGPEVLEKTLGTWPRSLAIVFFSTLIALLAVRFLLRRRQNAERGSTLLH